MNRPRRLLSIGHSYVVALNRRLAHEMARVGAERWEVTVAAPKFMRGDLRPITLESFPQEAARLIPISAYLTTSPHLLFYGALLRRLLSEPWDLIHCWEEPYVLAGGQIAFWSRKRPLVYQTFQNIPKCYPPPFRQLERFALQRARAWIAGGQTVVATLQGRPGYADKPHCIVGLGVDVDVFRPDRAAGNAIRQSLGWTDTGPPVVGYLGRFVPEKGLNLLMQALEWISVPWRVLFVGGGDLEGELRSWAARFPDSRVRVVTGVPHDQVPAYLNAMDILTAPSQTTRRWREQFGRMLIEAMACGVPVVGSDSGEIPFVIGDAGMVVPEADVQAWVSVLSTLLENPAQRAELAARGRERVHARFAWPVVARQHLDFFDEILDYGSPLSLNF